MAIVQEMSFFSWKDFQDDSQNLGDLERFKLVIDTIPDKSLIDALSNLRRNGRNDYPVIPTWNSILAGIVFQHSSVESLRRELLRNAQLREICGFNPLLGASAVPSRSAYSRFLTSLTDQEPLVRRIFDSLVKELTVLIPNFGKNLAGDGKALESFGNPSKKKEKDKRREKDADWAKKRYYGIDAEGKAWEKIKSWFGFRLHLVVDADVELPIAYAVTKASEGEQPVMDKLFEELHRMHPELLEQCEHAMFDKGYDSKDRICGLWEKYGIKGIIDIRNMWKDGEKTRQVKSKHIQNVTYDYKGTVFCHCPKTGELKKMTYGGFEKDRASHKYICPALSHGVSCKGASKCPIFQKFIRIPMEEDHRVFTPVARSSYKWKVLYNKRSSVERVNSRIEQSFEKHYIRGLSKMKTYCGLTLCVMLVIAVGRLRQNQSQLMRSLVKIAV